MKLGVSSYSFQAYTNDGKMSQLETIKKAKEIGFDCIEFIDMMPPEGVSQLDYAKKIKEEAEKVGIEISAYAIGANFAVLDVDAEIERVKGQVDIAKALGAKFMRHDVMYNYDVYRSFDLALPTIAKAVREVADYAQTLGVKTMSENHGFVCQDSDRIERLANAVNHPNFGLLIDIGNFICADEDHAIAVSRVANFAFMAHVKDPMSIPFEECDGIYTVPHSRGFNAIISKVCGKGATPIEQCLCILKRAGFDGYVDLEFEDRTLDDVFGVTESYKFLRPIFDKINSAK